MDIGTIRVVSGAARGRRLTVPREEGVRPTLNRIREALFTILGEQVHDAMLREVHEETGLSVTLLRLSGIYSHPNDSIYLHLGPQYHVVALVFVGTVWNARRKSEEPIQLTMNNETVNNEE